MGGAKDILDNEVIIFDIMQQTLLRLQKWGRIADWNILHTPQICSRNVVKLVEPHTFMYWSDHL